MIYYYTDGSCSPNPGPGGFAVIKNMEVFSYGHDFQSTNIRMEGVALLTALKDEIEKECVIYTDSEFWINVITKWASGWESKGWVKKGGEIKNLDLVIDLHNTYKISKAELRWVKGHEGDEGNELADQWANKARSSRISK